MNPTSCANPANNPIPAAMLITAANAPRPDPAAGTSDARTTGNMLAISPPSDRAAETARKIRRRRRGLYAGSSVVSAGSGEENIHQPASVTSLNTVPTICCSVSPATPNPEYPGAATVIFPPGVAPGVAAPAAPAEAAPLIIR